MIEKSIEKHNYYIGNYRIVHIMSKWRITIRDRQNFTKWNFINDIEYSTAQDAIDSISLIET
jgi:hypothetical protein